MVPPRVPAQHKPVARVLPMLGLLHLDRPFDYLVSEEQSDQAQAGVRVRVRFSGRLVDALLLERRSDTEHEGQLAYLDRVISPEVVCPPSTWRLVESLAVRYAGSRSDVLRAAIPARHGGAESSPTDTPWEKLGVSSEPDLSPWASYEHGQSFVDAVLAGTTARACWQINPGERWEETVAALAIKTVLEGGGALIVLPDQRDVDLVDAALREHVSAKQITQLTAALGPQARYRRFLSIVRGQARLVIGTRSAAFAPVHNLRLAILLFDGDHNLVDPRTPYLHAREVLTTRSALEGCSLLLGGISRTAEAQLLVEAGWAHDLVGTRAVVRGRSPMIRAAADSDYELERDPRAASSRIPMVAFQAMQRALERGNPVLVSVPRKGYVPVLACGQCRHPARCRRCNGPLGVGADGVPTCGWCGQLVPRFKCGECGSSKIRAVVLGSERTAEELGRAFPGIRVVSSGGERVLTHVDQEPAIVVATPGAEPKVRRGFYGAALLLDGWALLGRQDLRATEDTLAKWAAVASLVAPAQAGGEVVVMAESSLPVVQALIRWDMVGAAALELRQRREVSFPPAVHMAAIDGANAALDTFRSVLRLPEGAEILGPVDLPPGVTLPGEYDKQRFGPPQRLLVRTAPALSPGGRAASRSQLGAALRAAAIARTGRKDELPLRIQVDPLKVG